MNEIDAEIVHRDEKKALELLNKAKGLSHSDRHRLFHSAVLWNLENVAIKLIDMGININSISNDTVIAAFRNAMTKVCNKLIKLNVDINLQDFQGYTPLMEAIDSRMTDLAINLIDLGAKINLQDFRNRTALWWCIEETRQSYNRPKLDDFYKLAIKLMDHGADLYLRDIVNKNALDYIREYRIIELLKHIDTMYSFKILEVINEPTIIGICFRKPFADLHTVDIISSFIVP